MELNPNTPAEEVTASAPRRGRRPRVEVEEQTAAPTASLETLTSEVSVNEQLQDRNKTIRKLTKELQDVKASSEVMINAAVSAHTLIESQNAELTQEISRLQRQLAEHKQLESATLVTIQNSLNNLIGTINVLRAKEEV